MINLFEFEGCIQIRCEGADCELPLAPALVLFGKNDAGKTNLLRAVAHAVVGDWGSPREKVFAGHEEAHGVQSVGGDIVLPFDPSSVRHLRLFAHCFPEGVEIGFSGGGGDFIEHRARRLPGVRDTIDWRAGFGSDAPSPGIDENARDEAYAAYFTDVCRAVDAWGARCRGPRSENWAGARLSLWGNGSSDLASLDDGLFVLRPVMTGDGVWAAPAGELVQVVCDERLLRGTVTDSEVTRLHRTIDAHISGATRPGYMGERWSSVADPWFDAESDRPSAAAAAACATLSELANSIAAAFITRDYRIEVQPLSPRVWHQNDGKRIRVALVADEGPVLDRSGVRRWLEGFPPGYGLDAVGEGVRVWTRFAVLEAIRRLSPRPLRLGEEGELPTLYIFDEPELHLHPSAQVDAARFVADLVKSGGHVILATHSPAFLNEPILGARTIVVHRTDGLTRTTEIEGGRLDRIERLADSMGLTRADIIQLTRGVLLVEGHHDRCVIEGFFGRELAEAHVRVLSLRGAHQVRGLADADLLLGLGIPLCLMLDKTRGEIVGVWNQNARQTDAARRQLESVYGSSREERELVELLGWLVKNPRWEQFTIQAVPFPHPDIAWAIPEAAVNLLAPGFEGWAQVNAELQRRGRCNPKDVCRELGFEVTFPNLSRAVALAREHGYEPDSALKAAIAKVIEQVTGSG